MFSQRVKSVMEHKKLLIASPQTSVGNAARLMAKKGTSAVMIVQQDLLVGIFTERDAVFRVMARGLDLQSTCLADVMTPSPQTVNPEQTFGSALLLMQANGFRHVPVVLNGKPVGMVTPRSALDPELEEFVAEEQRRKHFV